MVPIIPRYPSIVTPVANHLARKEIERQWLAKGQRIQRYATIVEQARALVVARAACHPVIVVK